MCAISGLDPTRLVESATNRNSPTVCLKVNASLSDSGVDSSDDSSV